MVGIRRMPVLSVVMPLFNAADFVAEAICSVLEQSFQEFELLVIEDGSSDQSWEVLSMFEDPRIRRFRHLENCGISVTMNEGLDAARGRYIAIMDADDICVAGRLSSQLDHLDRNRHFVACGTNLVAMTPDGRRLHRRYPRDPEEIAAGMLFNSTVAHPTMMFRTDFLRRYGLRYDESLQRAQDYELLTRISRLGAISNLDQIGCVYRLHDHGKHADWLSETRTTASRIRAGLARQLGFSGVGVDAQLHDFIATGGREGGSHSIGEVSGWLDRASRANREVGVWNASALDRTLREHFFRLCLNKTCPKGVIWCEMREAVLFGDLFSRSWLFAGFALRRARRSAADIVRNHRFKAAVGQGLD